MIPDLTLVSERQSYKPSVFNVFDAYKGVAIQHPALVGEDKHTFNERLEEVLSLVFVNRNPNILSKDQYKLYSRYVNQSSNLVDADLKQLDIYLGSL